MTVPGRAPRLWRRLAALALLGAAVSGCADAAARTSAADATESSGPAVCGASISKPGNTGDGGSRDQLVPTGASDATLCVYAVPFKPQADPTTWPLTERRELVKPVGKLVGYVNGLPVDTRKDRVCAMMLAPAFTIIFGYPDGGSATVNVNLPCSTVDREGNVRDLTSGKELMSYWKS